MSLSEKQMLDVMAFADGELDDEERDRVAKMIEDDAEAAELFASLRAIGDGVRSSFDVPVDGSAEGGTSQTSKFDVRDVVMRGIMPNDLDKARIKRTARTRMMVVGASLLAVAAAVAFYVRQQATETTGQNTAPSASNQTVLASSSATGVEVDFVDTPTPVSVFYVPAEKTTTGAEGKTTEAPESVVVWVDDNAPTETPP